MKQKSGFVSFSPIRRGIGTRSAALFFGPLLLLILSFAGPTSGAVSYFLDRAAWERAAGGPVWTETFDHFPVPPNYQLPPGINEIGILKIEVQRYSGNLIVPGNWFDTVNGSPFWRIEAATQNGPTPPVTPILRFDRPVTAFGADFNSPFPPRLTLSADGVTVRLSDYVAGARNGFFGFVSTVPFETVKFDVVSPFNTLHHADNVSFVVVPEPGTVSLAGLGALALLAAFRVRRSR